MPELFIDGRPLQAENGQTVIEVARAHGIDIPHFCWHPSLSVSGSCRL
jgi:NADH-quinone oxidoreductase subunit G